MEPYRYALPRPCTYQALVDKVVEANKCVANYNINNECYANASLLGVISTVASAIFISMPVAIVFGTCTAITVIIWFKAKRKSKQDIKDYHFIFERADFHRRGYIEVPKEGDFKITGGTFDEQVRNFPKPCSKFEIDKPS